VQTVLAIFWHIILALTGALGFAALVVAGAALCCGGAAFGCAWLWRGRRRKRR
jgi:hypothetical protein